MTPAEIRAERLASLQRRGLTAADPRQTLPLKEAARRVGVTRSAIQWRIRAGAIDAVRIPMPGGCGYRFEVTPAVVDRLIAERADLARRGRKRPMRLCSTVQQVAA